MADVSLHSILDDARKAIDAGEAERAIGMGQYILHHFPALIEGHRLLGEAYLHSDQPEAAIKEFHEVLRADPEHIGAFYGLGLAHQRLRQGLAAIRAFESALEIQPNLAELRTQLLRLYTETPGSAGQFRLSRSGLGRLYARGQMFSQAIDEFQAVLLDEPDRDDVRAALAETLWRDGREDEAADWCRETIERSPQLHKPTLILGYVQLASGMPEGEVLWRRAAAQEPTLHTARSLFEIMPPIELEEGRVPAYDAYAWQEQQQRMVEAGNYRPEHEAGLAQTAALPAATADNQTEDDLWERPTSPVGVADQRDARDAGSAADELEPFALPEEDDQRAEAPNAEDAQPRINTPLEPLAGEVVPDPDPEHASQNGVTAEAALSDDDLLAQLLGLDMVAAVDTPVAHGEAEEVMPPARRADVAEPPRAHSSIDDFSFEAWELEEQDVPASARGDQPFLADQEGDDFGAAVPFYLDDEGEETAATARREDQSSAEEDAMPFSLSELGLSDDELATMRQKPSTTQKATSEPDDEALPFSLADLGLDAEATATPDAAAPSQSSNDDRDWTTQSLRDAEVGGDFESAARAILSEDDDSEDRPTPSSELSSSATGELPSWLSEDTSEETVDEAGLPQWLRDQWAVPATDAAAGTPDPSDPGATVQPDDVDLDVPPFVLADLDTGADDLPARAAETTDDVPPFSFAELGLDPTDFADLELRESGATADSSENAEDLGVAPFSLDDLEDDQGTADTRNGEGLADLGLSDEELAQFNEEPALDTYPARSDVGSLSEADEDVDLFALPTSLTDLGIRIDEPAETDEVNEQQGAEPQKSRADAERVHAADQEQDATDPASSDNLEGVPTAADHAIDDSDPFDVTDFLVEEPEPSTAATSAEQAAAGRGAQEESDEAREAHGRLAMFFERLEVEPDNHAMRLAVARMSEQVGDIESAIDQYRRLIRHGALLDPVVEDLRELTTGEYDRPLLRRVHRLLGDAYMKQERLREAMDEYSWT